MLIRKTAKNIVESMISRGEESVPGVNGMRVVEKDGGYIKLTFNIKQIF